MVERERERPLRRRNPPPSRRASARGAARRGGLSAHVPVVARLVLAVNQLVHGARVSCHRARSRAPRPGSGAPGRRAAAGAAGWLWRGGLGSRTQRVRLVRGEERGVSD